MIDIDSITFQVKHNCNVSDAKYWGYYSPCGLLLRLRDLYRIEHALKPWERIKNREIGEWIDRREKLWQELEEQDFLKIKVDEKQYDPFDVKGINSHIEEHGYVYGAGYGNLLKPLFIFARLNEKSRRGRFVVRVAGREIARDLSTSPAMIRGNTILLRHETMNMFFWSKYEEMKATRCNGALLHAFSEYGISKDMGRTMSPESLAERITMLTESELSGYIHHEIGEASQRRNLGRWWKDLLFQLPYSRAELFLRALKDILSDTCTSGMLSYIIKNKKAGSLGFYIALLSGFRKIIFPDILPAYERFIRNQDWACIERARLEGYNKAGKYVRKLKEMSDKDMVSAGAIDKELISRM